MAKLFLIVGGLIFVIVAYFTQIDTTKQEFEQVNSEQEEDTNSTPCPGDQEEEDEEEEEEEDLGCLANVHQKIWAGHSFEMAYFDTNQYETSGNKDIKFYDNGWYAPSYSLPRSKLLDVNMNQKIKIKVIANMEGKLESDVSSCATDDCRSGNSYPFAEFAIYFVDSRDTYEIKYGIALLGTSDRIGAGHTRDEFKFSWFSVENTGKEIIFEDSNGRRLVLDENSQTQHKLSDLNQDDEWRLRINCHVNGEGYCKLEMKEIQIIK